MARVEEVLRKITGHPVVFRIEAAAGAASPAAAQAAEDEEKTPSRYQRQRAEALKEPMVKRAMEVLGAQLVDVDDGFATAVTPVPDRAGAMADSEEA